jgi:predicted Zn-dependent peptidase
MNFHKTVLPNQLTIIGEHNPNAQSFAAGYFVNTGSRDEQSDVAGVSHFLEHMMFKGTARRSAEDINLEFDALGANYNAYTNEERTVYYGAVLPERSHQLLDLLTDMMRPSLREEDFAVEKHVILEEIAMYQDRPSFTVFEKGSGKFFNGHPLGNSVLGSVDSIQALKVEQMNDYFQYRYAPNNMTLVVAGHYDWDRVTEQIEKQSASWQAAPNPRTYTLPQPKVGQEHELDTSLKRTHVAFFAPGISAQNDLHYAASLLASCIGDSTGSRLYWSLVDKGLVDSAGLYHEVADGYGMFSGYVSTAPEQLAEVKDIFTQELLKVEREGLSLDEWNRAQRKLATSLTLRSETPFGRLMYLGSSYLYTKTYQSTSDVIGSINKASLNDANMILSTNPFSQLYSFALQP